MIEKEITNVDTDIKHVIAVMSGKGGVGKSSMSSLIALSLNLQGYSVGILDADITGPSIPKIFGINDMRATGHENTITPVETATGIKIISLNLLIDKEDAPVIWRGPLLANAVKQFYTDVNWGNLDYLIIDLPPGTGDVSITIMQSLPIAGIFVISTPQDLVNLIVKKSINMAKMMDIPVLGLIENMSYFSCPTCGGKSYIFGETDPENLDLGINLITQMPIDPKFVELCDAGKVEHYTRVKQELFESFSKAVNDTLAKQLG